MFAILNKTEMTSFEHESACFTAPLVELEVECLAQRTRSLIRTLIPTQICRFQQSLKIIVLVLKSEAFYVIHPEVRASNSNYFIKRRSVILSSSLGSFRADNLLLLSSVTDYDNKQ